MWRIEHMQNIDIRSFYIEEFEIDSIVEKNDRIQVKLHIKTDSITCPMCGSQSRWNYKTSTRKITDLPILGKQTELFIKIKQYECSDEECQEKVLFSSVVGFTEPYRRMTSRCEDVVCAIALNMNCESASRICALMGIPVSGDTVIRMLLRRYDEQPPIECGEIIGMVDWAIKKRHTYGTIICDGITHKPIELLSGRDGQEFRAWLQQNKHIKIVTRDRASAYAKAISDVLPEIIQTADRFHLANNLMTAVKSSINGQMLTRILLEDLPDPEPASNSREKK